MGYLRRINVLIGLVLVILGFLVVFQAVRKYTHENAVLRQVIERLSADSRIAEVLVTNVRYDEKAGKAFTTVKFLEYDAAQKPLAPRYFTFAGNIIQFQSLVIRFDDFYVKRGDRLRGKSAYLFWKVFMLEGTNTQEYAITPLEGIPAGYKLTKNTAEGYERRLWRAFWNYALQPAPAKKRTGIKNAQIEAPGTLFVPGILYTIKIEHDGGMRIDTAPLPEILRGERIPE